MAGLLRASARIAPEVMKESLLQAAEEAEVRFLKRGPIQEVMRNEENLLRDLSNRWVREGIVKEKNDGD